MKYPKDKARMEQLLIHLNITAYRLVKDLKYKNPSSVYKVLNGTQGISKEMAEKIVVLHTEVNFNWLLGYDKTMLLAEQEASQQKALNMNLTNEIKTKTNQEQVNTQILSDLAQIKKMLSKLVT